MLAGQIDRRLAGGGGNLSESAPWLKEKNRGCTLLPTNMAARGRYLEDESRLEGKVKTLSGFTKETSPQLKTYRTKSVCVKTQTRVISNRFSVFYPQILAQKGQTGDQ